MKVDILYCAWNRMEFTTQTWAWMMAHTNWEYVNKLVVYDDGSEDGTAEFLRDNVEALQSQRRAVTTEFRQSNFGAPAAIMNHYLATSEVELFAKIDNDIALPGSWLDRMYHVLVAHPEVELLGMEAGMVCMEGRDGIHYELGVEPCSHVGGVGLFRAAAFRSRPPIPHRGRFGFTEWQDRYDPSRAWIVPDIHCPQLDRVPVEPYISLAEQYVENGWSRPWTAYDPEWCAPYYHWIFE